MDEKFDILDCAQISDEELVRILTRDKDDYTAATLRLANREAWQRKLDVMQFIDRVEVSLNDGEPASCTIDAATAFMQTAQLCMSFTKDWPQDYLDEAESYLEHLAARLSENLPLRHTLANIALFNEDDKKAKEYFEPILALAPADSVAHVNLGHLYAQDQRERSRAVWHYQRYLELEPQAEDRAAIESMLAGL
jgi:tetratricopeptide (TPR) repeat protein